MRHTNDMRDFLASSAKYAKKELLIRGWQVMQDWEDPYMAALAAVASRKGGVVLELGFGMGISARHVQSQAIDRHMVIEAHPDVVRHALDLMSGPIAIGRFTLLHSFRQHIVPYLADEMFDGILLDTSPLSDETVYHHDHEFFGHAHRLLKPGGTFTFFSDESKELAPSHVAALLGLGFSQVDSFIIDVEHPHDCRYWRESTLVVPVITK